MDNDTSMVCSADTKYMTDSAADELRRELEHNSDFDIHELPNIINLLLIDGHIVKADYNVEISW